MSIAVPSLRTYQLLESKADAAALRGCLTYWLVLGMFFLVESIVDSIFFWVPMYKFIRLSAQVWLWNKNFAGADLVYKYSIQAGLQQVDEFVKIVMKDTPVVIDQKKN